MKFRKLEFQEYQAQVSYNQYFKKVQKIIKKLPKEDQEDILMQLNSHIYEAMQNKKWIDGIEAINEILDQLGEPKEIWGEIEFEKGLISTKNEKKDQNKQTLKSYAQDFKISTLYTLSYGLMVWSIISISCKIYFGEKFGLYYREGEYFVLGGIEDGVYYLLEYERMGIWYIPFWTMCFLLSCYFIKELKKEEKLLQLKNELAI